MCFLTRTSRFSLCLFVLFTFVSAAPFLFGEQLQNPPLVLTGSDPRTASVGDFNGDGKPDLAYLDGASPSLLHILLGNGDATFQHGSDIVLPPGIGGAITIADVNGDGHDDILIGGGNQFQAELAVLLGQGNGAFSTPIISQFATTFTSFADLPFRFGVADFNGDGAADLIVTDPLNQLIWVLLGDNTGSFKLKTTLGNSSAPVLVLTNDFNGDGHPDFLVRGGLGNDVTVYLGVGDGTFQPGVSYTGPHNIGSVVLADMDGDGHLDMVVGGFGNTIDILHGNPDGTFATLSSGGTTVPGPTFSIFAVADFNGDGIPDLAITSAGGIGIILGQGSLTYGPVTYFVAGTSQAFTFPVLGDFNSDLHPDFAVPARDGILLLLGNPDGTLQSVDTYLVAQGIFSVAVADFNSDGFPDIAADSPPQNPFMLLGNGLGKFTTGPAPAPGGISGPLTFTGDFNGDGKPDLLLGGVTASSVVLYGNGNATFSPPLALPRAVIGFTGSALGDFNGDGITDVIATNIESLDVFLGHTNNTFSLLSSIIPSISSPNAPAVGDFNKDGKLDVVYNDVSGLQILLGNGNGTFTGGRLLPAFGTLAVADFDGDGNLDIVAAAADQFTAGAGRFTVFFGNGDGTFQPGLVFPHSLKFVDQLVAADMDGDGRPDLLMTDENLIVVIHYAGARSFGPEVHYAAGSIATFAVRDLNGDGLADLAVANGNVSVLLNHSGKTTPTGSFTITPDPSAFGQPFTLTLALNAPVAGGSVIFSVDGTPVANVPVSAGAASFTPADTSSFALGPHAFAAFYTGDTSFTSAVFPRQHTVVPSIHPTTITLTASPATVLLSQTIRLVATVTSAGPTPGGTVAIHDGTVNIGTTTLDPSTGIGIFDTALLAPGTHSLTAVYQGDVNSAPGSSAPVSVVVNGLATSTDLATLPAAPQAGSSFALMATVTSSSGTPFGNASFFDGTTLLGTRAVDSTGVAVFTSTFSAPGSHSFTASYHANGPYLGSTSSVLNLQPIAPANFSTAATLSITDDAANARILLESQLTPLVRSGKVLFLAGSTQLGAATVSTSGKAVLDVAGLFPGAHYFTAVFTGDSHSSNAAATVLVGSLSPTNPDFAVHLSSPTARLANGQSASLRMQIDPLNGFNDEITLSCSTTSAITCSFLPASLNSGGNSVVTLALLPSGAALAAPSPWMSYKGPLSLAGLGLLFLFVSPWTARRALLGTVGSMCLLAAVGCGGSSFSRSTLAAPVSVTVTAASAHSAISHSIPVTLAIAPRD